MSPLWLGYEELLAQRRDGSLWYYKISVYGSMSTVLASDRFAPTPGGIVMKPSSIEIVEQIPLDTYERQVYTQARDENLKTTGRADESFIFFDLLLFACTWGSSSVATRIVTGALLLFNIATGQSDGPGGAFAGRLVEKLWEKSLWKLLNLNKEVVVQIGAGGTMQALGAIGAPDGRKRVGPATRKLHKILEFRRIVANSLWKRMTAAEMKAIQDRLSKAAWR